MEKQKFKKINFNEAMERYLIFEKTPEKKLLSIISGLKDLFPKQKEWRNLEDNRNQKELELIEKFRKKGKLYRKICQNWINNNMSLVEEFNKSFQDTDKEVSTKDLLKFFENIKNKYSLSSKDLAIFVHIYIENSLCMALFEDSASILDKELEKELVN